MRPSAARSSASPVPKACVGGLFDRDSCTDGCVTLAVRLPPLSAVPTYLFLVPCDITLTHPDPTVLTLPWLAFWARRWDEQERRERAPPEEEQWGLTSGMHSNLTPNWNWEMGSVRGPVHTVLHDGHGPSIYKRLACWL